MIANNGGEFTGVNDKAERLLALLTDRDELASRLLTDWDSNPCVRIDEPSSDMLLQALIRRVNPLTITGYSRGSSRLHLEDKIEEKQRVTIADMDTPQLANALVETAQAQTRRTVRKMREELNTAVLTVTDSYFGTERKKSPKFPAPLFIHEQTHAPLENALGNTQDPPFVTYDSYFEPGSLILRERGRNYSLQDLSKDLPPHTPKAIMKFKTPREIENPEPRE